jgi:hypothetical protein
MAKFNSFNYQYTLLMRDSDDQRVNGTVSCRDLAGTRRLARSILRLNSAYALVDIYPHGRSAAALENDVPLERVSLDDADEQEGGRA